MEKWVDSAIYPEFYQVSNMGRLRTKERVIYKPKTGYKGLIKYTYKARVLKCSASKRGYLFAHIGVNKKNTTIQLGRLVLMSFVGDCPEGMECCHNNGDSLDNRLENLRWDTHAENNRDRIIHKTIIKGSQHHFNKFPEDVKKGIQNGVISYRCAKKLGVSTTHFYRLKRMGGEHVAPQPLS